MGDAQSEIATRNYLTQFAYGTELEAPHMPAIIAKKHDVIGSRALHYLFTRRPRQINRADLVLRAGKKHRVLSCAIEKRAVIAMTELQHPPLSWAHAGSSHPSPPTH